MTADDFAEALEPALGPPRGRKDLDRETILAVIEEAMAAERTIGCRRRWIRCTA